MAYSTITKPKDYFNTVKYTGTGSSNAITGVGFQPDITWCKNRNVTTFDSRIFDVNRGANTKLVINEAVAESTTTQELMSFDSDGFTLGTEGGINQSGTNFMSWNWLAGGTPSSNTDGTITSSVSANTTSGVSIITYTGNGTGSATFGHGLGAAPKIAIIKRRDVQDGWQLWYNNTIRLQLNTTAGDAGNFPISTSSTVVTTPSTVDTAWNTSGGSYISYCFAEKKGFSKFGTYVGNASSDGNFIYTGFKPAFFWAKNTNSGKTESWALFDNQRQNNYNAVNAYFRSDSSAAELTTQNWLDFVSNGVKFRYGPEGNYNQTDTFIYMAFAEQPLVANTGGGIPATAR